MITSITSQNPWYAVASVLSDSFGITNPLSDSNHWAENVLVLVMGVAGCYLIYKIFAIWDGGQTESGYKLRYRGEEPRLTLEAFAELRRLMAGEFKQEIFEPIEDWRKSVPIKPTFPR